MKNSSYIETWEPKIGDWWKRGVIPTGPALTNSAARKRLPTLFFHHKLAALFVRDWPKDIWTNVIAITMYPIITDNIDPDPDRLLRMRKIIIQYSTYRKEEEGEKKHVRYPYSQSVHESLRVTHLQMLDICGNPSRDNLTAASIPNRPIASRSMGYYWAPSRYPFQKGPLTVVWFGVLWSLALFLAFSLGITTVR